ncbi:uncharacterized protein JCM6883_001091 [Sporobolomyces salmoneus]|uniref:uncharacterized protein n=1 Tax=Sporobolomyces salmoneus TaxID=183962 RepID=UPI00317ADD55
MFSLATRRLAHPSYRILVASPPSSLRSVTVRSFHLSRPSRSDILPLDPSSSSPSPSHGSSSDSSAQIDEAAALPRAEHAVISTFDLFSIGVGPSSSHTVGPMRAGKIFVNDLIDLGLLEKVKTIKIGLFGSLAATGKGHLTPEAIMMGLEGGDPETIEPSTINSRYAKILDTSTLSLNSTHSISYTHRRDMIWTMEPLPLHPNGMKFSVFDKEGDMLATNTYFSVGGGFVVNEQTQVDENLYYRSIKKNDADHSRRDQTHGLPASQLLDVSKSLPSPSSSSESTTTESKQEETKEEKQETNVPPYLFRNANGLLNMTRQHNLTIAQLVWENERAFRTDEEINDTLLQIWNVMDQSIHAGISSKEEMLPGRLRVRRRAPGLYKKLFKGFYPTLNSSPLTSSLPASSGPPLALPTTSSPDDPSASSSPSALRRRTSHSKAPLVVGSPDHPLSPPPPKRPTFPGLDFLSLYAIAVNETNAGGGRVVTAPTNGAAGVIPAVLKYLIEFISDDPQRDTQTFLLTAAAIGMLYKRGATISAAEGGCMAEVGVSTSMAAGGYTACLGGSPAQILQAAEIGIEHSLGLSCDPVDGLVAIPCIERNALGSVKAVTAAQLALAGDGQHSVTLDEAIEAMRQTARDMHTSYKETSLAGLATSVRIPISSPAC